MREPDANPASHSRHKRPDGAPPALTWEQRELRIGPRGRPIRAHVAQAPAGSWYVIWRTEDGWSIGHAETLEEPESIREAEDALAMFGDAKLVADAWAAGVGAIVGQHRDYRVEVFENDEGELVAASWECPCGESGVDFDNVGEAGAAARAHWRDAIRAALTVTS